jgi:adenylyl- and sulfurtransferase ThiI
MSRMHTTILGWTGRGNFEDLESSVQFALRTRGFKARVSKAGYSVAVEGPEPLGVAAALGQMPGVAWIAAGGTCSSMTEMSALAGALAKKYLRRGDSFSVEAQAAGKAAASDAGGSMTSKILESVKGSRVSVESPKVLFRATFDGAKGVLGVEVKRGPGGMPTGREWATCLVSGGYHSSVLAWHAVLLGFRVRLVHAKLNDESLRAVAGLYSELSHRCDPRWLSLEVLEGNSVLATLSGYAEQSKDHVFGGFSLFHEQRLFRLPGVLAPLYLLPEERFREEFQALGIRNYDWEEDWEKKRSEKQLARKFGGATADVSGVIDGLA